MNKETNVREGEVIETKPEASISVAPTDSIIQAANEAEGRIDAINKIKQMAFKVTNSRDWIDEGGNPYLQASGSQKIARLFEISWRIGDPKLEPLEDGHYLYVYKGVFLFTKSGISIEAIGTRSSKSPFFSIKYKKNVPVPDIDRANVMKSAYTNCVANGVTSLLGLRNLTWEELTKAGITKSGSSSVNFKSKGSAKPAAKTSDNKPEESTGGPVEKQWVVNGAKETFVKGDCIKCGDKDVFVMQGNNICYTCHKKIEKEEA